MLIKVQDNHICADRVAHCGSFALSDVPFGCTNREITTIQSANPQSSLYVHNAKQPPQRLEQLILSQNQLFQSLRGLYYVMSLVQSILVQSSLVQSLIRPVYIQHSLYLIRLVQTSLYLNHCSLVYIQSSLYPVQTRNSTFDRSSVTIERIFKLATKLK